MNWDARQLAADFDLEKLTPEFYADPYPTYRALRENAPVKRLPNGCYFLTRYDDLVTAHKTTKVFSSDKKKEFLPKYGDSLLYEHHTTSLVFNDPPAHTRVRRLIMGALSPRAIAGMEPDLILLVDALIDALAAKGKVEGKDALQHGTSAGVLALKPFLAGNEEPGDHPRRVSREPLQAACDQPGVHRSHCRTVEKRCACCKVEITAMVDSAPWLRFTPSACRPSNPPPVSGSHMSCRASLSPMNQAAAA